MAQEQNYTTGFNSGYKLQKYSPDVYELLESSLSEDNEWQRGILEGSAQAKLEKEKERLAELQSLTNEQEQSQEQEEDYEQ